METTLNVIVSFDTETEQIDRIVVSTIETETDVLDLSGHQLDELDTESSVDTAVSEILASYGYVLDSLDGHDGGLTDDLYGSCTGEISTEQVIAETGIEDLGIVSARATSGGHIAIVLPPLQTECECGSGYSEAESGFWTAHLIGHTTPCCSTSIQNLRPTREVVEITDESTLESIKAEVEQLVQDLEGDKSEAASWELQAMRVELEDAATQLAEALESGQDLFDALDAAQVSGSPSWDRAHELALNDGVLECWTFDVWTGDEEGLLVQLDGEFLARVRSALDAQSAAV